MVATDDNKTRRMRFTCWITMATGTQSEYVILIASSTVAMVTGTRLLPYTYSACPVITLPWNTSTCFRKE